MPNSQPFSRLASRVGGVWERVSRHPLWATLLAALIISGIGGLTKLVDPLSLLDGGDASTALSGPEWGPPRRTYRCEEHAFCEGGDHVSLNSTINKPAWGDARFFLSGKVEGSVGPVGNLLPVKPGDVIQLRMVLVNDGDPNILHPRSLLARGVTARLELPRDPANQLRIVGWLSAGNANPQSVFDSLNLESEEPFAVHLISGSAVLQNRAHPQGLRLPNSLVEEGAMLGYRRLDGNLDTCFCHAGYVLAKVVVASS